MIATFAAERMGAYVAGGMNPAAAACFTCGELAAIYNGDHYSRDAAGTMRPTPPPEALNADMAMNKCDATITEILNYCAEQAKKETPLNTETEKAETYGAAPENAHRETPNTSGADYRVSGLEGLKNYVKGKPL